MKVLITEAASLLGVAVREELSNLHELRLISGRSNARKGILRRNLLDPTEAEKAVAGMDALVYIPRSLTTPAPTSPEEEHAELDAATRATYHLYMAAIRAGVKKIMHVSSLSVMEGWPKDYIVTEIWSPCPAPSARSLGFYLSEEISREVTRESEMFVTCLRMATLVREKDVIGQPFDPTWLEVRDAASACRFALDWEPHWSRWIRTHIAPKHPYAVWPSLHTSSSRHGEVKWDPKHDFNAWWPKDPQEGTTGHGVEEGGTE